MSITSSTWRTGGTDRTGEQDLAPHDNIVRPGWDVVVQDLRCHLDKERSWSVVGKVMRAGSWSIPGQDLCHKAVSTRLEKEFRVGLDRVRDHILNLDRDREERAVPA